MLLNNKIVKRCERWIDYFYKKQRIYNPDFEVDGIIYEVKGNITWLDIQKHKEAKLQNIEIELITYTKIKEYKESIQKQLNISFRGSEKKFVDIVKAIEI